jgi:hypothetical protein
MSWNYGVSKTMGRSDENAAKRNDWGPEKWARLQTTVVSALKPHSEAWDAVVAALEAEDVAP